MVVKYKTINCMINKTSALAAHGWQSMNPLHTSTPLYRKIKHLRMYIPFDHGRAERL